MPGNLINIPASVYATWPTPNYKHPSPQWRWLTPFTLVIQGVVTIMVLTRLWLRLNHRAGALGLDDAFLVPAFIFSAAFSTTVVIANLHYGVDRHVWDVPPKYFEGTVLLAWLSELLFLLSSCCNKISILFFYRRLTNGTVSRRWKYATWVAIGFTAIYGLALILALIFNCSPTESYWKAFSPTYHKNYHCADTRAINPVAGALSVFSDLYAVLLPMGMLRHFDVPRRQKLALNGVFSMGLLVVGCGCARTYWIYELGHSYDMTRTGYYLYVWSVLELQIALICASAPALRVFVREYLADPFARALVSAKNVTSVTSPKTTANLGSGQTQQGSMSWRAHQRTLSASSVEQGGPALVQHKAEPSLGTVGEARVYDDFKSPLPPRNPSQASTSHPVRTPEEFEAYALRNLQRNRPPPRAPHQRQYSDNYAQDMRESLETPFTDCYSPPDRPR